MIDSLTRLKTALADWQQRKAGAETRLETLHKILTKAAIDGETDQVLFAIQSSLNDANSDLTIAEWQVKGIQGAIDCEEALRAGTITLSQMYANADDVIDDLRLELLR
jgi:hypothetical protein